MATNRALHRQEAERALRAVGDGAVPATLETSTLDFKRFKAGPSGDRDRVRAGAQDIAEAAACFANSAGGTIVIGVADDAAGPAAFVGVPGVVDPDDLRHRVWQATSPGLVVEVEEQVVHGVRLLLVGIQAGFELVRSGGKLRERLDAHCVPMSPEREARVREDRRGYDWSAEQSALSADDVSDLALEEARRLLRQAGDAQSVRRATLGRADLLRECGLLDDANRLNRAGVVLFCTPPADAPSLTVQYLRRRSPAGPLSRPPAVLREPLVLTVAEALRQVEAVNETTPVTLPSGVQQQLETIPAAAVREALVNAVAHRDYRLPDPVVVEHSPRALVVTSPGELVFGVTEGNLITHVSKPRNRTLAEALHVLRLAERAGTGVDVMVRAMVRAGHVPPEFQSRDGRVRVVLTGGAPAPRVAGLIAALPDELRDDTDTALVIHHLRSHAKVDARTIAPVIQKTEGEASDVLRRLSDDAFDLLEATRETRRARAPAFRFRGRVRAELGTLLPYHRHEQDETEQRVVAHVREYGTISNETVKNLFQVNVVRASVILRELSDREILRRTPTSPKRGPTVRYEAGARFPARARRRSSACAEAEGQA